MVNKYEGIVIRTTDYGESNKIVTIYSREAGKIAGMARGAKKPNNRLASVSQLFTYGYFVISGTKGLGTIQQGEMISSFRYIREDIFKTAYSSYIVDLLDKGTEEKEINPFLFELLYQTLHYINEGYDPDIITNLFEMKMLNVFGLYPEMNQCVFCGNTESRFGFSIKENGLICQECFHKDPHFFPVSQNTIKLLRLFYFFDIHRLGSISVKEETKKQLRDVISTYYDEYSGLKLKTKRFLDQLGNWKSQFDVNN
ncbi:DNA repair protein RecO [Lederbergia sp. NSJ-179]|uniref:DNA repair protein RecO n=1 Tax=Lederbergia sp. NSJ-179 TaxID=2931402 RepID=UPI001FD35D1E|nr:DNA repair protein RecO [Lederbergia sp. NSJ-179]MCJ7841850.1 DNA repair protein RecO [Lederbergia sp. NSJ-179]